MSATSLTTATTAGTERRKVGMLVPPPVLLGALVKLAAVAQLLWFGGFSYSLPRSVAGGLLLAASMALVAWCSGLFKRAGTPVRPTSPSTAIVRTGPYRISRHPMYLGMAGVLAGLGLVTGSACAVVAVALFIGIVHFGVVVREERYLAQVHGEAYRRYQQQVRCWL
jgi:protein-S-isoprenylcysteine O-methyltransferase Ste14